jgi:hypothetical protein
MAGSHPRSTQRHWLDRIATLLARPRTHSGLVAAPALAGVSGTGLHTHSVIAQEGGTARTLGDAATAEGLLVTLLGVARTKAGEMALDDATIRLMRATQCEEEAHFNNLVAAGAVPTSNRFSIAEAVFANPTSFLATWLDLEQIMVGIYLAAARALAEQQAFDLVEIAYQIGVVEGQHQVLLRQMTGERLPADRAFVAWRYPDTATALAEITDLGFIDGSGTPYDYPGPGDRYCRGVTGLVAETTSDQGPPDVTPAPPASPDASPTSNE